MGADRDARSDDAPTVLRAAPDGAVEATEPALPPTAGGAIDPGAAKYEDLGRLGRGGMADVRRVRDPALNRVMALKVIRPEAMSSGGLARFVEEAQVTAQLQHPGVVPLHELGTLPDGRPYFTMKEVRGRTLSGVIKEVHGASMGGAWLPGTSGWTFHRLVAALHRVCEAVGYAHHRGVVHRDLKPTNVMVGSFGEVLVLDWGIAKVQTDEAALPELDPDTDEGLALSTDRERDGLELTRTGVLTGTPQYMAPEQAAGRGVDARTDVYSLGAMLYLILSARRPYGSARGFAAVEAVRAGPPPPVAEVARDRPPLPPELVEVCERAMARAPDDRFNDAGAMAKAIEAWLEGSRRRAQAQEVLERAQATIPEAEQLRDLAGHLRVRADTLLADVPLHAPEGDKAEAWRLQDRAQELDRQAALKLLEREQLLSAALTHDPDLLEAHAALATDQLDAMARAEDVRDAEAAARAEIRLRAHGDALPEDHPTRRRCAAWLEGDGALTLRTRPTGARVFLHEMVLRNRRLVPGPARELGTSPIERRSLPRGSYLLRIVAKGHHDLRFPVCIRRQEHVHATPPGASEPEALALPPFGTLDTDEVYVPAGWFEAGGDPQAGGDPVPRQRLWCPSFSLRRHPVTNREYLAFLNDLLAQGREEEALAAAPRERGGTAGSEGSVIYGRDERGQFALRPDADGDTWDPEWPVIMVHWGCAVAYARWLGAQTGKPWRLPAELEWEKAARGVDGRFFPWGDQHDPSWAVGRLTHPGRPQPAHIDAAPTDTSLYGVRGMAGNVQDWCGDVYERAGPAVEDGRVVVPPLVASSQVDPHIRRAVRGGYWIGSEGSARCAYRSGGEPTLRFGWLGIRLARSM